MRLDLPTHCITYTNGVNYRIPIYWELYQNDQLIKSNFATNGGMYNDILHDNYNNHPDGSSMELPVGFTNVYRFKFWHLGKINLPILLLCFAGNSSNTNNRSGMIDNNAYQVEMGSYKQFDFILTNNPDNYSKINCNAGWILEDGSFTYNIPSPITLQDVTGSNETDTATGFRRIVPKLGHRIKDNVSLEWFNISTTIATGARIQNVQTLAGVANVFYIEPIIVPPPPVGTQYHHFNAEDYFDVFKNPAVRSPIKFCFGAPSDVLATVESQLMRKQESELALCIQPYNAAPYVFRKNNLPGNSEIIDGYLFSKSDSVLGSAFCVVFTNPLSSKVGCRIKAKKHSVWNRDAKITIKSGITESIIEHGITDNLLHIVDYITAAAASKVYVFIEQTTGLVIQPFLGLNFSAEFFCEKNNEIIEPFLYKEDAALFLGDNEVKTILFETFTSTTDFTDLSTISENAWQPNNIISIPTAGVYHIYGRATLPNGDKKVAKIRSFTQS